MEWQPATASLPLRSVFVDLGLATDWTTISEEPPSYRIEWPGVRLQASRVTNQYLMPIWMILGTFRNARSMGMVEFPMPVLVESREQAIAWMADSLIYRKRLPDPPAWLSEGLDWRTELPWVRRQMAYEARDQCLIERDWFRLPCKRMIEWAAKADPTAVASFNFDGEVLRISAMDELLVMPATGRVWAKSACIEVSGLQRLPKRLMQPEQTVSVWEGHLYISRLRLPLLGKVDAE